MTMRLAWRTAAVGCAVLLLTSCQGQRARSVTVPFVLDHNRMLIDAEIQRKDGSWRTARLWVDTGNPDFFMSEALARDLGIDLSAAGEKPADGPARPIQVPPPSGVRIGGMPLKFEGVGSLVMSEPRWLFSTMHNEANLPSTVLKQYQVVFDYPGRRLTIAEPGALRPRGRRAAAGVHPTTGIVQIDAVVGGENLSFALDNGASYSFASEAVVARLAGSHPDWPRSSGAVGCANIWGWWPREESWPIVRVPVIDWGSIPLEGVGIVGLPNFFGDPPDVGAWYSQKTARPVAGFLGPNAFKAYRVEIDYANGAVYFEKGAEPDLHDMDLVGLTLRPEPDGGYRVIGIAAKDGKPAVEGVAPGDRLLKVGGLEVTGATMGAVVTRSGGSRATSDPSSSSGTAGRSGSRPGWSASFRSGRAPSRWDRPVTGGRRQPRGRWCTIAPSIGDEPAQEGGCEMAHVPKVLLGLASLAFLLAIYVGLRGPIFMNVPAESYSRASNNLALIAIGLMLCWRCDTAAKP